MVNTKSVFLLYLFLCSLSLCDSLALVINQRVDLGQLKSCLVIETKVIGFRLFGNGNKAAK